MTAAQLNGQHFEVHAFNTLLPFYADVEKTPDYVANTDKNVSTDNFYWTSYRLIAAMADASLQEFSCSMLSVIKVM